MEMGSISHLVPVAGEAPVQVQMGVYKGDSSETASGDTEIHTIALLPTAFLTVGTSSTGRGHNDKCSQHPFFVSLQISAPT